MRREAGTSEPARGHRRDPRRIRRRADVAVHVRHYDPHLQTLRSPERPAVPWADLRSDRPAEAAAEPVVHAPELDEASCNPPHGLDDHGARARALDHRAYDPDDDEARARHLDLADRDRPRRGDAHVLAVAGDVVTCLTLHAVGAAATFRAIRVAVAQLQRVSAGACVERVTAAAAVARVAAR